MTDDAPPLDPLVEAGRKFFAGPWDFIWAAMKIDGLPPMAGQEIAFAGRSNVGKSSLINALTGRKALCRTSNTPGRTQQLNFFRQVGSGADERLTIVDMPGYGFAAVGKDKVAAWTRLIHAYLRGRSNLLRVYVLIDARHGFKDVDTDILDTLDTTAMSYQIVLTKADAVKVSARQDVIAKARDAIARRPAAYPDVLLTSSEEGLGIGELRAAIMQVLEERS